MTDDDKAHVAVARANASKLILEDPLFIEAFDLLDKAYTASWRETPARDVEAREKIWIAQGILGKVRGHLMSVVNDGKVAKKQIDQDFERKKRFQVFG